MADVTCTCPLSDLFSFFQIFFRIYSLLTDLWWTFFDVSLTQTLREHTKHYFGYGLDNSTMLKSRCGLDPKAPACWMHNSRYGFATLNTAWVLMHIWQINDVWVQMRTCLNRSKPFKLFKRLNRLNGYNLWFGLRNQHFYCANIFY